MEVQEAIKSDGSVIRVGDEVEAKTQSGYFRKCEGVVFVVESIQDLPGYCKTGYLVVAHVKDQPERKLLAAVTKAVSVSNSGTGLGLF